MAQPEVAAQATNNQGNPNRKALYDAIEGSGKFKLGDEAWFNKLLDDDSLSVELYKALEGSGAFKLPSQEDWGIKFGKKKDQTGSEDSGTGLPSQAGDNQLPIGVRAPEPETFETTNLADAFLPPQQEKKKAEGFDLNTPQGVRLDIQKRLALDIGKAEGDIVDVIQSELDAGTITEEEANKRLETDFAAAQDQLIEQYETEFTESITAMAEKEEAAKGDVVTTVPSFLGFLGAATGRPTPIVKIKQIKNLNPFERGLLNGIQMFKAIPEQLGLVSSTGTIKGANDLLEMTKDMPEDEVLGEFGTVKELREKLNAEKTKAIESGLEDFRVAKEKLTKFQAGSKVPESFDDINSYEEFGDFALNTIGQAMPQAVGAIGATLIGAVSPPAGIVAMGAVGLGTVALETGTIQMEMIEELAKQKGLTVEQILEQALVDPKFALAGGLFAGSLDMLSLGLVLKGTGLQTLARKFIKEGVKKIGKDMTLKEVTKQVGKGILVSTISEGLTEPSQGVIESYSAAKGAEGIDFKFDAKKFKTEMAAGSIMGFTLGGAGKMTSVGANLAFRGQAIREEANLKKSAAVLLRKAKKPIPAAAATETTTKKPPPPPPAAGAATIKKGSVMTVDGKKLKYVDGKWKFKSKKGKFVAVPAKQQEGLTEKYVQAKQKKDGKTSQGTTKGKETKAKGTGDKGKKASPAGKTKGQSQPSSLAANEKVASSIKVGDTITDSTGATYQAKEVLHAKDGLVTIKDEQGVVRSVSPNTVLNVEGAAKAPSTQKGKTKAKAVVKDKLPTKEPSKAPSTQKEKAKAAAGKVVKKKVEKVEKTPPPVEKKAPLKDIIPDNPAAIQNALSNAMRESNKASERLATAKEQGHVYRTGKNKGQAKPKAPEWVAAAIEAAAEKSEKVAGLRKAFDDSKKKATPKPEPIKEAASLQDQIDDVNRQIRELEPASKRVVSDMIDKVHQPKKHAPLKKGFEHLVEKVANLKKQRKILREQLGKRGVIENDVARLDPKAIVNQVGKPKKIGKSGTVETDYTFKAVGLEGSIKRIASKGSPDLFYAFTADGKTTTAFDTAREAVKSLRQAQPRHLTQTGAPVVVEVFGNEGIGKLQGETIEGINTNPKVVRAELGLKDENQRSLKVFIEGGEIATVSLTKRGKVHTINKKTGQSHKKFIPSSSRALKNNPDIALAMKDPKNAKPATDRAMEQQIEKKVTGDPNKMTEKAKVGAAKIRGAKVKIENGVLRASLGFEEVYNAALEIAATVLEGGGQFADAIRAAMKHMRQSKWYRELATEEKALKDQMVEDEIRNIFLQAGRPLNKKDIDRVANRERDRIFKENRGLRKDKAQWAIFQRRVDLSTYAFKTHAFIQGINLKTSPTEREILPFIMEKTPVPEALGRPDLVEAYNNRDVKKLDKIAEEIRVEMKDIWTRTEKHRENITSEEIVDYVTHIWDIKKNERTDVITHFTAKDKWNAPRYIETLMEGIERFQLTPKMLDISEILAVRSSSANNMMANADFVENIKGMKVNGKKVVLPTAEAAEGWGNINVPALKGLRFHPDIQKKLGAIFRLRLSDNDSLNAIERLNAFIKGSQLSASFFHHFALLEASIPILGYKTVDAVVRQSLGRGIASLYGKGTDIYADMTGEPSKEKLKSGLPYTLQNQEMSLEAIKHGLQLGSTLDVRVKEMESIFGKITNLTEMIGEKTGNLFGVKGAGKITKAPAAIIEGVVKANNALLWDYLHDTLKLMAYQQKISKTPKSKNTPQLVKEYKIEQAAFINDSFGGQNFDVLGFSPSALQGAKILLLSPDWTLSTLRQAAPLLFTPFHQVAKTKGWKYAEEKFGALVAGRDILGREFSGNYNSEAFFRKAMGARFKSSANDRALTAHKFWAGALAVMGIAYMAWNAWNRKEDMEENPDKYSKKEKDDWETLMMWRNTSGHITHVFDGRYEDGTERYIRQGKQFRELPEFFLDDTPEPSVSFPRPALKKFGGKGSPVAQIINKAFNNKSLSGYEDYSMKDKEGWAWTAAYVETTAKSLAPFAFSTIWRDDKEFHALDLIFPSSKGMSVTKGIKLLQYYMVTNNPRKQALVMQEAIRNDLNISDMYTAAMAGFQAEQTKELYRDYKTLGAVYDALENPTLSAKDIQRLVKQAKKMEVDIAEKRMGYTTIFTNLTKWVKLRVGEQELEGDELDQMIKYIGEKAFEAEETYKDLRERGITGGVVKEKDDL